MRPLRAFLTNHPLANVTFAVVLLIGFLAYQRMPREQDPEVNFNWVSIATFLPGASAEDIERLVTKPIEDAIKQVADVRFVSSSSREGASSILVRFRDLSERMVDKRVNDLRREIENKARSELPSEAKDPRIMEITTSNGFPTAMVLVVGEADDESLRYNARTVKEDLERMSGVDQVFASGMHDPELQVEFDPQRLASRGLRATDLADSVGAFFRDTFAGKARSGGEEWLVRVIGTSEDPGHLARLLIASAANPRAKVPLEALARAERGRARPARLVSYEGKPSVLLAVTKKSYTNTLQLVERISGYLEAKNRLFAGSGLRLVLADDQTIPTRNAIGIMERNALQGLALVLALVWVFLGTRMSILVSLGIPFSLAGTFALLHASGYTLNISVLLGVVIVLGMLVDDAVVVVEAIYYRVQRGADALSAAVESLKEVAAPVASSVATTVAAFLPLMLLPGIVGEFMFVIPFVVSVALAISLVEAFWMLPAHVVALRLDLSRPSRLQAWRHGYTHALRVKYSQALIHVMRHPKRYLAIGIALMLGAAAAVASGAVRIQFFAFDPIRLFYVNVDMPAGAPVEATLAETERVAKAVRKHLVQGETRALTAYSGLKFTDTEPLYGDAYGQIAVALNPRREDMRDVPEIIDAMRKEVESLSGPGRKTFLMLSGGPPLSKPVRVRARGDEYAELRAAADAVKAIVTRIPGARDVADDDVPGQPELVLELDREAVRNAGLNPGQVARLVRLHVDGEIVAVMRDRGEKLEVRVRRQGVERADIGSLLSEPVALPGGATTTLAALVRAETRSGKGVIKHYNLRRSITVEADLVKEQTDTLAANNSIKAEWEAIKARYPQVDLDFSGELDDIQESLEAMKFLFLLGVGLIYLILAAQFRSYWQPLMILVTVPLAFTGVTYGLLLSRNPLSLYTLYGVIALTGIAVNSAIVLIDAANERLRSGMSVLHASIYAARRRVVPIIITSTTTIGGLLSLALGLGGRSLLWGPVAASIVWGLGFATVLTLFVIPLIYRLAMQRSRLARRLKKGARLES
ncbi:MAG: efflux RND transporter permease subunit [Betaproteobacteria bacterium]|nr:efflux RND transporter permease subunit [Betaproteobacteria bacterium]